MESGVLTIQYIKLCFIFLVIFMRNLLFLPVIHGLYIIILVGLMVPYESLGVLINNKLSYEHISPFPQKYIVLQIEQEHYLSETDKLIYLFIISALILSTNTTI